MKNSPKTYAVKYAPSELSSTHCAYALLLGCANKDLWGLCAPISIIVVYSKTATSYYFGAKE